MKKHWGVMGAWVAYVWATTLAGLAIHPYKSVKRMVMGDTVWLPTTLSPALGLLGLFVMGRVFSYIFTLGPVARELVAGVLGSTLIGLLLWQGLLLALVWRFFRAR